MSTALIRPEWSGINIALMVAGFVIFAPLGLAMLAYILWGEHFGGTSERAGKWMNCKKKGYSSSRRHRRQNTGNLAFDDYRAQEMDRLEEERRKLENERQEFENFLHDVHMARDRNEFDQFMANRGSYKHTNDESPKSVPSKKKNKDKD